MARADYVPGRGDIVWLDFEPTRGREIGKYRPALVLSSREYNRQTGLLICCPISTSIRGGSTEVPIGNLDQPAVVAANLVQTLAWQERKAKKIISAKPEEFRATLLKLLPCLGRSTSWASEPFGPAAGPRTPPILLGPVARASRVTDGLASWTCPPSVVGQEVVLHDGELPFSEENADAYRLFGFRKHPLLFTLPDDVGQHVKLRPVKLPRAVKNVGQGTVQRASIGWPAGREAARNRSMHGLNSPSAAARVTRWRGPPHTRA